MRNAPQLALASLLILLSGLPACGTTPPAAPAPKASVARCFLLESDDGTVHVRSPAELCATRIAPHSTFKIPHALFALDAGVVKGPDDAIAWDHVQRDVPIWNRDHTLASATRYSAVWFFQKLAERLGPEREKEYLTRIGYGNADPSSGLTTFWLGGSLAISPDEQSGFLQRFFAGTLPFPRESIGQVRSMLVQPRGVFVRPTKEVPFGPNAPEGTVVEAKSGAGDHEGERTRWIVGHVTLADKTRGYRFVSAVRGPVDATPSDAAVDLAASRLAEEHVF